MLLRWPTFNRLRVLIREVQQVQHTLKGWVCAEGQTELAYSLIENRYLFIFSIAGNAFHEHEHGKFIEVAVPPQLGVLMQGMVSDIEGLDCDGQCILHCLILARECDALAPRYGSFSLWKALRFALFLVRV